ncbi:HEAT repeat domain-containing protein [Caminibacter pacificus]|uniref:HEAT repeat domain-containing protein n=1 Tax=Caminibacter pacificus TaxID=1424653 RepID=A0AAJ4UWX9_9BACT|nr:HEAT repeat domain-containing protein [Caminibacter pacificus]QDD68184.1 HEAT repeat domain-containing protein [Caminibacter pacificus]ROR38697.1 hypothetical protein EDC58_1912 [Caminibacter pacificus]
MLCTYNGLEVIPNINLKFVKNFANQKELERYANSNCVEIRKAVASSYNVPVTLLAKLAKDPDVEVKKSVAINPNTPSYILAKLAKDPDSEVRELVLYNLNTPEFVIKHLTNDPDKKVREEAKSMLRILNS